MTNPSWQDFGTHDESAYPELWDGVVGAWCPSLGPTGLRLHDHSRRNNWGTLTNMDAATDWTVSGGQYALDFDGVDDYVRVPSVPQWRAVSAWVSLTTTGVLQMIADGYNGTPDDRGFLLFADASGKARIDGRNSTGTYRSSGASTTTITGVGWVHLVGQYSDRLQIYVNGVLESQTASALTAFSTMPDLNIGALGFAGLPESGYVNGRIDNVVLYDRALSANEIQRLYLLGRGGMYQRRRRTLRRVAVEQAAAFKAYWARRNSQIIGGGV
jgi:hypothetical protein